MLKKHHSLNQWCRNSSLVIAIQSYEQSFCRDKETINVVMDRIKQDTYEKTQEKNFITKSKIKKKHINQTIDSKNEKTALKWKPSHLRGIKH